MEEIRENVCLKALNTFGIAANARYLQPIRSIEQAKFVLSDWRFHEQPKLVLGGGSNILFTQNYPGLVLKNEIAGIETVREEDDAIWLRIGAGENWHGFVMHCVTNNYGGVENLSLIPGTVGAAPIQNIGAYGVELKDVFHSLTAIRFDNLQCAEFNHEQCQFGYRDSIFKRSHQNQYLITDVTLRLQKKFTFNLNYHGLKEALNNIHEEQLSLKLISDAIIKIRQHKLPDPNILGNAGSFFKNPLITSAEFEVLKTKHPTLPYFTADNHYKIPAAWLIEQCGYKGKRRGDVGTHHNQPLVLVNFGNGQGQQLAELASEIQHSVYQKFNILLETEVNII